MNRVRKILLNVLPLVWELVGEASIWVMKICEVRRLARDLMHRKKMNSFKFWQ